MARRRKPAAAEPPQAATEPGRSNPPGFVSVRFREPHVLDGQHYAEGAIAQLPADLADGLVARRACVRVG